MQNMHINKSKNMHVMLSSMHSNPAKMMMTQHNTTSGTSRTQTNNPSKPKPLSIIRTRAQPYNFVPVPPYGRVYGRTPRDEERLLEISRYLARHNLVLVKSATAGEGFILRILSTEQARQRLETRFGDRYRPPDSWIVEDPSYIGLVCSWEYSSATSHSSTASNDGGATATTAATTTNEDASSNTTITAMKGPLENKTTWSESILEILDNYYNHSGRGEL